MTLLHRDFGHGDRVAACFGGRRGILEVFEIQLMVADGEIGRGDGSIDVDERATLFAHMPQGVLVGANRLAVGGVPLRKLPGSLPIFRRSGRVARAFQMRGQRFRRRFDDSRLQPRQA